MVGIKVEFKFMGFLELAFVKIVLQVTDSHAYWGVKILDWTTKVFLTPVFVPNNEYINK